MSHDLRMHPLALPEDADRLCEFLTQDEWPFHGNARLGEDRARAMIDAGQFHGSNHRTFWIRDGEGKDVGILRLFDIDDIEDGYPLFDLRIRTAARGQGHGQVAVKWLADYVFNEWPKLDRLMGSTRVDNLAMRKVFRACGFVKEGHYRRDWATADGSRFDTVKYGLLREDWLHGRLTPVNWEDEA